jgi:hypothetical protein
MVFLKPVLFAFSSAIDKTTFMNPTKCLSIEEVDQIVERLIYLDGVFKDSAPSTILAKFILPSKTADLIVTLQKIARQIARYLNLGDLTFLITLQTQQKSVAGRIHLNRTSNLVEIELSPWILGFEDAILSTICHEIVHRFLFRHGVSNIDDLENEKLTDTAAAYLGLGHFMVEGSACERTDYTSRGRSITKLQTGYLTPGEFGLTYALVTMARVSRGLDRFDKLSYEAQNRVWNAERQFQDAFPRKKRETPSHLAALEALEFRITSLQRSDLSPTCFHDSRGVDTQERIRFVRRPLHLQLHELQKLVHLVSCQTNAATAYLHCCRGLIRSLALSQKYPQMSITARARLACASLFWVSEAFVFCPYCLQKLRLKQGTSRATVRCAKCYYRFVAYVRGTGLISKIRFSFLLASRWN